MIVRDRIRLGIVGANLSADPLRHSWGARAHLPALRALPEFEIVAVCTNHLDSARRTASHFGIPLAFDDVAAMVEHPDVDVVDVCVAASSHHQVTLQAVGAGKHVVCEWPLGADLAESRELRDTAEAAGVLHAIGLQARYAPTYQYMRTLVAGGAVGRVLSCTLNGSMAMSPSPRSASLALIHGGHCLDTLCFVVGQDLSRTSAIVDIDPVANHVLIHGCLDGGALVDVNIRHVPVFGTGLTFEVDGTEGVLVAAIDGTDLPARGIRSLGEQLNQATLRGARAGAPVTDMVVPEEHRWVPAEVGTGPALAVAQLFRRFGEAVRSGTRPESDFGLAVRRHEQFDTLARNSEAGPVVL
jgi:predicted dehydrogenase